MAELDASSAKCFVFTFKEGLLSAVAHDLKVEVTKFSIRIEENSRAIHATFDPRSLRVRCAMKDGQEAPTTLSAKDVRDIEQNIEKDVLIPKKHSEIRFTSKSVESQGGRVLVNGTLDLHGKTKDIGFSARRERDDFVAEARVHQPDFGIKPYSALLGTLKIKPEIIVRIEVPARLVDPSG